MAHIFVSRHGAMSACDQLYPQLPWQPAADVYRCAGGWLVKFELAGVRQEDIQVEADNRGITVSGSRRDFRQLELQETHLMEIAYNRFERFVALPEAIENVQLRVEYRDGMLYVQAITMNKQEPR
ncbi:MAG: Hsp20/alpha crystallin family protein [Pirellulales bacterium]